MGFRAVPSILVCPSHEARPDQPNCARALHISYPTWTVRNLRAEQRKLGGLRAADFPQLGIQSGQTILRRRSLGRQVLGGHLLHCFDVRRHSERSQKHDDAGDLAKCHSTRSTQRALACDTHTRERCTARGWRPPVFNKYAYRRDLERRPAWSWRRSAHAWSSLVHAWGNSSDISGRPRCCVGCGYALMSGGPARCRAFGELVSPCGFVGEVLRT